MPRWCVFLLAIVGSVACGGTPAPSAPSAPASIAGDWSGTFHAVRDGTTSSVSLRLTARQTGASVNGTWEAATADGVFPVSDDDGNSYGLWGFLAGELTGTKFSGRLAF